LLPKKIFLYLNIEPSANWDKLFEKYLWEVLSKTIKCFNYFFRSFSLSFTHLYIWDLIQYEKDISSLKKLNFERLKIKVCNVNSFNKQTEGISKIMKMCFDAQTIVDSFFCQKQNKKQNKNQSKKIKKQASGKKKTHVSVGLGFTANMLFCLDF